MFRFVLDVSRVDGDAAGLFFGSRVDLIVCLGFAAELRSENRADGSRQRGLAMVNVTDGAHVHVGLGAFKLTLCHGLTPEQKPGMNPGVFQKTF